MLLKAAAPRCARTLGDALALVMLAKEPCDTVYLPGSLVIVEAGGSGIRLTREAAHCDGACGSDDLSNRSYVPGPGVMAVVPSTRAPLTPAVLNDSPFGASRKRWCVVVTGYLPGPSSGDVGRRTVPKRGTALLKAGDAEFTSARDVQRESSL